MARHPLLLSPRLEELRIDQFFFSMPADVRFPNTLRRLECRTDTLELSDRATLTPTRTAVLPAQSTLKEACGSTAHARS